MSSTSPRKILLIASLLCTGLAPGAALAKVVHVLPYEGAITPIAAEYLIEGIEAAEEDLAEAVVIQLDTPGGLDTAMRDIIKAMMASHVPVIVYVAPSGSRAASAGAFITVASHVAAMAPGTNIGSASPVSMGGGGMDSTMVKKVTHDAAAYIESIATKRGRNAELARAFVENADNVTAEEALEQNIIEIIAPSVPALMDSLQGRLVEIDGGKRALDTADAELSRRPMGFRQRLLKALVDPNVAYILMLLGIYGLFFELSNPGALVPGILGGICLLLALFAFQSLPINYAGAGLILLGVIMLILEVKVTSFGALTIGGLISMTLGSLMLFDTADAWARLSLGVIIPAVLVFAGFFILCVWLVLRSHRRPVVTGKSALAGERGRVIEAIPGGEATGKIVFHGEIWDARSATSIGQGDHVTVDRVEGRVAEVHSEES